MSLFSKEKNSLHPNILSLLGYSLPHWRIFAMAVKNLCAFVKLYENSLGSHNHMGGIYIRNRTYLHKSSIKVSNTWPSLKHMLDAWVFQDQSPSLRPSDYLPDHLIFHNRLWYVLSWDEAHKKRKCFTLYTFYIRIIIRLYAYTWSVLKMMIVLLNNLTLLICVVLNHDYNGFNFIVIFF